MVKIRFFILIIFIINCSSKKEILVSDCKTIEDLKLLDKDTIVEKSRKFINRINASMRGETMKFLYHYPEELYFNKNCNFPNNPELIGFLFSVLYLYPESKIYIEGNCDSKEYKINEKLGLERAEMTKLVFVKNGIDSSRFVIIDEKNTKPISSNKNENSRKNNRYVRMIIPDSIFIK